jgi:FAD/FMN-containing dehydrogenase/Fe-S oxidoreductase
MEKAQRKTPAWNDLKTSLGDRLHTDHLTRVLYATDASVYRKLPLAVAYPKDSTDVQSIVAFCRKNSVAFIPRTAGTSLAGQCVGEGLVVDFSRFMTKIFEVNKAEKWVLLEPGVIRDELNEFVKKDGLFFGPNTSTANRCMMGGMVGNNSSGTTSIRYGVTRDKVIELEAVLSDGSLATFGEMNARELTGALQSDTLRSKILRALIDELSPPETRREIEERFPKREIHRRNTGYAIDILAAMQPFNPAGEAFNAAKLIAGSEGTLCAITKIKLQLDNLPPPFEAVVCAHFSSVHEAMVATVEAMKSKPFACEVMDKTILDLTKGNPEQAENRFFVEGDPGAILCVELRADCEEALNRACDELVGHLKNLELGFAYPVVKSPETARVWTLRAAGLGVLSNLKGKAKPVAFVEDTAVAVNDLPQYIDEFEKLMDSFGQQAVYYAHAGAGELHLRPVLDLKSKKGRDEFRQIGEASAKLVKKYRGSLSGEHGDGRVRAEFIPDMIGEKNYALLKRIKKIWDPTNIFNPGKIVDPDPMDADFRYEENQRSFDYPTFFNFSEEGNMLELAEKCNGSGDCRKLPYTAATMCPSYHATRNEKDTTRARANVLREVLTRSPHAAFPFDNDEVHEVLDLCISCKACKRECPSSVDMSLLKMEADYHYYRRNGLPKRNKFFGSFHKKAKWGSALAPVSNLLTGSTFLMKIFKSKFGIAPNRSIPKFSGKKATSRLKSKAVKSPDFVLYVDEFTQYQDAHIAEAAGEFFKKLNFSFDVVYAASGRAYFSKSMLPEAKECAEEILRKLKPYVEEKIPIVGLEPSGILGFRDEFKRLFVNEKKSLADKLSSLSFTFEEFVAAQMKSGRIRQEEFTDDSCAIEVHVHCHQKALSGPAFSLEILNFPPNYSAVKIPAGCCGMAGSFGYEAEHFDISNQIGEQILFPRLRSLDSKKIVVAAGTSCRHQIKDGVGKESFHPAEILLKALK